MRRVLIIGSAGAGKSTLARALGEILQLPVIHLDAEFWQPGWRAMPKDEWKSRVRQLVSGEQWIIDGNYGGTMADRIPAADTVILLALSRWTCLLRVLRRSIAGYGKTRADLRAGCPEQLPDLEFLRFIWTYPALKLPGVLSLLQSSPGERTVIVLRTAPEVQAYVAQLAEERG